MSFLALDFIAQRLFNTLFSEIEKWKVAKEKGKSIIQKSIAHMHYPIFENKTR